MTIYGSSEKIKFLSLFFFSHLFFPEVLPREKISLQFQRIKMILCVHDYVYMCMCVPV